MPDTYVICVSLLLYIHNKSPCKTGGEMWVRELVKKNTNCGQEGVPFLFSLSIGGNQQRRVCKRLNCILVIWLRSSKQVDLLCVRWRAGCTRKDSIQQYKPLHFELHLQRFPSCFFLSNMVSYGCTCSPLYFFPFSSRSDSIKLLCCRCKQVSQ